MDSENFAAVLESFPHQFREVAHLGKNVHASFNEHVAICGMGGSGLPGEIAKRLVKKLPVLLVKDYVLPSYVTGTVFIISYSGNTEETLELYEQAKKRSLKIIVITSGGELEKRAVKDNQTLINVPVPHAGPSGFQPRMAVAYQTVPLLNVLATAGIVDASDWNACAAFLEEQKETIKTNAREIAKSIGTSIPIIYSSEQFYAAAFKWKVNLNENAKMHAFCHAFPEWNHHEINAQHDNRFTVIMLRDKDDPIRVGQRMMLIQAILLNKGVSASIIDSVGSSRIERVFWSMYLGDWVSYYTAIDRGVDPTPITMVEELKKQLKPHLSSSVKYK